MNDVTVERERAAKAEPGKLVGPASHVARLAYSSGVLRPELPAVREALAAWGVDGRSGDANLLATELVADAAGHAGSSPGSSAKSPDTSLDLPGPGGPPPTLIAVRGIAIVTARATASCVRAEPGGKTAWLTPQPRQPRPFARCHNGRRSGCHAAVTAPSPT